MANRSDREQGQPNLSLRRHSLNNRMGPCSRTPSGPAVSTDCINRPDRRLHPTSATTSIYPLQRGSHPQRTSPQVIVPSPPPPPLRVMRAYQASGHLSVAVRHAFVLIRPTT